MPTLQQSIYRKPDCHYTGSWLAVLDIKDMSFMVLLEEQINPTLHLLGKECSILLIDFPMVTNIHLQLPVGL